MSCSYPVIKDLECGGEAIVTINDHFKWIDYKTAEIVAFTEKIARSIGPVQSMIPAIAHLQTAVDGVSGLSRIDAYQNTLTTFPSTTCCYGKPLTLFYPYEIYSKEDYDVKVLQWLNSNFDPTDTDCNFNELYIVAFKGYEDEKAANRSNMLMQNYTSVFDVTQNNERFMVGRFYRSGYPILRWNLSPTLSPFACTEGLTTKVDLCVEIDNIPTVYYYKFTSCTIPGLVFYSAQDYNYLLGLGAILDGYPNDIFLVSRVVASNQPLKNDLTVLLTTKAGCGQSCYLLTNEFGDSIVSTSNILEAYACRTSVELEGFTGTWSVEKTTEGCDCACVVVVSRSNIDVYKLTNCCAAFLPCPDVKIENVPKDIWVFDNTGRNYLQAGKAVELDEYPGVRWSVATELFNNQKITTDYKIVNIFENCKAFAKPNPIPKTYYKLVGSCLNSFRTDLYSNSTILKPYVGKVVNINFDTRNYFLVAEFLTTSDITTTVSVIDVNLYGNNFPEFNSAARIVGDIISDRDTYQDVELIGAEYYSKPTPLYTNEPFPACKRRFSYWNDVNMGGWVKNKVENYSKILASWYEGESWYSYSYSQLTSLVARALSLSDTEVAAYLAANNIYIEIYTTFKRYRNILRSSLNQMYGEETDSIGEITQIKIYNASVSTVASFDGLVSCGNVIRAVSYCSGASTCFVDVGGNLTNMSAGIISINGEPHTISSTTADECIKITAIGASDGGGMSEAEAIVQCLSISPPTDIVPYQFRDECCNPIQFFYDSANDRWYFDAARRNRVDGLYVGADAFGLDSSSLYKFRFGRASYIGPHCCNNAEKYYKECCLIGNVDVWRDPVISNKVYEDACSCNRAQEDGGCPGSAGSYIKDTNPCALWTVTNCIETISNPFHCHQQETYTDCEDNTITLYIDKDTGLYYANSEDACRCSGTTYTNEGPLGEGAGRPIDGGAAFSSGIKTFNEKKCGESCACADIDTGLKDLFDCPEYGLSDPALYIVGARSVNTRIPCTNVGQQLTCGNSCNDPTTTPPPGNCCQDYGLEPGPLPEWGDNWNSITQYCLSPIDAYVDCYQYVGPTTAPPTTAPPTTAPSP